MNNSKTELDKEIKDLLAKLGVVSDDDILDVEEEEAADDFDDFDDF